MADLLSFERAARIIVTPYTQDSEDISTWPGHGLDGVDKESKSGKLLHCLLAACVIQSSYRPAFTAQASSQPPCCKIAASQALPTVTV